MFRKGYEVKILYIGKIKSIIKNLEELGVEIVYSTLDSFDGIIVTNCLSFEEVDNLKGYNKPLIVSGNPNVIYQDIGVLILHEDEIGTFYVNNKISGLQSCKDKLKEMRIKYLVVSLGKQQIQNQIKYKLPEMTTQQVPITTKEVEKVKDVITSIIGYIYIKEGKLTSNAIQQANIGTIDRLINESDYYLNIKPRRKE